MKDVPLLALPGDDAAPAQRHVKGEHPPTRNTPFVVAAADETEMSWV